MSKRGGSLSIMIPTFNCASLLRETLESLKQQGEIIRDAQIEVIDDCSITDDPAAVVRDVFGGRVGFFRQQKNVGPIANFNTCLARATRDWVQILHGDDVLLNGAYEEYRECTNLVPDAAAVFARTVDMDAQGIWTGMSPRLGFKQRGMFEYDPIEWSTCLVQFAGVLFRRAAADELGGFDRRFSHVADWNLWWRFARSMRVAYSNRCVGGYRIFEGNHTSTLRRSGKNLAETVEQAKLVFADYPKSADAQRFWQPTIHKIISQCRVYADEPEHFRANASIIDSLPGGVVPVRARARICLMRLRRMICR
jgi:glycosyltransferase involved in cell wall biosynthesis